MAKKKQVKIEITPEQRREQDLKNAIGDLKFIPEPTRLLSIGEKVSIGNLKDCIIVDVLCNGKLYEIDYTSEKTNYGSPILIKNVRGFFNWLKVRRINPNISERLIQNDDIRISFSQTDIGGLLHKVYYFGVDFNPNYQRDFVWEFEDKVALIDSIFKHVEIGKFAFIHNSDQKWHDTGFSYEILDGKQRLNALKEFYEDKFKYKGLYYSDLHGYDKSHFNNYPVSVGEVREMTEEQVLRYFVNLNRHGKIMDKSQIEKVEKMLEEYEIVIQ